MIDASKAREGLKKGGYAAIMKSLYPADQIPVQAIRYEQALDQFEALFGTGREVEFLSAPGRTEIGGNHTDHQQGRVLAAAVDLDILCTAAKNSDNIIRVKSEGFPQDTVDLGQLDIQEEEKNSSLSLIRGIAARFVRLGYQVGGFDAYTTSNVLKGSGLSSSAAFEVAVGTMLNHLFNDGKISAIEIAQISQYAENNYFGKPSGLMDQMASSVGGFVAIDFEDPEHPVVEPIPFDFAGAGYTLCIVDTKGDHAHLTDEYAAVTHEMNGVAAYLGVSVLRQADEELFWQKLSQIRKECGDRAALRAIHFFGDNARVLKQAQALRDGDFERFKELIIESGRSSFTQLQNVFSVKSTREQGLSLALAVSERILSGRGAWRVHGGGFAGTIQAFVPGNLLDIYRRTMWNLFGEDSCYTLQIRPVGGVKISME